MIQVIGILKLLEQMELQITNAEIQMGMKKFGVIMQWLIMKIGGIAHQHQPKMLRNVLCIPTWSKIATLEIMVPLIQRTTTRELAIFIEWIMAWTGKVWDQPQVQERNITIIMYKKNIALLVARP